MIFFIKTDAKMLWKILARSKIAIKWGLSQGGKLGLTFRKTNQ